MVARHWRGWTAAQNANAYEIFLKTHVLPKLKNIEGYRGGYVLRRDAAPEVEFVVINLFDSLEAVKQFANPKDQGLIRDAGVNARVQEFIRAHSVARATIDKDDELKQTSLKTPGAVLVHVIKLEHH